MNPVDHFRKRKWCTYDHQEMDFRGQKISSSIKRAQNWRHFIIMEAENYNTPRQDNAAYNDDFNKTGKTIPVIEEQLRVEKKVVETGKVHVSKKVIEQETAVTMPVTEETYDVQRVPINQVVETPPPPVRYEGDTMIIPVLREVMVVKKHYEIIEEIRLTKQTQQHQQTEQVTLLKEQVTVERSGNNGKENV